jgi:tRNA(fMet)-specific endonuclease VapC
MILLDSDHVSILVDPRQAPREKPMSRLDEAGDEAALPVVVVEEQLRGWLAAIHRIRDPHKQVVPYLRLTKLVDFFCDWRVMAWNEPAADIFARLRRSHVRIGTQDLKIAAITLANDATLLSANLRDFGKVPGLRVEDWLSD